MIYLSVGESRGSNGNATIEIAINKNALPPGGGGVSDEENAVEDI